jgi:DNA-binding transcriptional MerR regulator
MTASFTIGDLSREFGVTLRTLRFYEDRALLTPRRDGTRRLYGRRDRARLRIVLLGKRVGLSLAEIKQVLDIYDLKSGKPPQLSAALDAFRRQIDALRRQKADIELAIAELTRTMEVVSGMLRNQQRAHVNMAAGDA